MRHLEDAGRQKDAGMKVPNVGPSPSMSRLGCRLFDYAPTCLCVAPRPGRVANASEVAENTSMWAFGHPTASTFAGACSAGRAASGRSIRRVRPAPSCPSNAAASGCGPIFKSRKPSRCGDLGRLARAQDLSASVTVFTRWQPARSCESRPRWPATFPEENRTFRSSVDRELVS